MEYENCCEQTFNMHSCINIDMCIDTDRYMFVYGVVDRVLIFVFGILPFIKLLHIFLRILESRLQIVEPRMECWKCAFGRNANACIENEKNASSFTYLHERKARKFECMNRTVHSYKYIQRERREIDIAMEWNYPINFMSIPND